MRNYRSHLYHVGLTGLGGQDRRPRPAEILLNSLTQAWTQEELIKMGYILRFADSTSAPITAIYIDSEHGSLWGGASNFEDDYGIG
jgi:gamma-glutamyltranspeptidase / glutathione hydrolase